MSLLVVGSVALDTVETPHGRVESVLGGSAVYFALAARCFCPVRLVGAVGEDFPKEHIRMLENHSVDLEGLAVRPGQSFRWTGRYKGRMDVADTVDVQHNVFEDYKPRLPESYKDSKFVFLANADPVTQLSVLEQVNGPTFVMADTMNLWIETERAALLTLMQRVDGLILNETEALQLTEESSLLGAARWICGHGPRYCVIKKGEHGVLLRGPREIVVLPGFPVDELKDPTGAGDTFAGGFMGHVASAEAFDVYTVKMALAYGTIMASFVITEFSVDGVKERTEEDVESRLRAFIGFTHLPGM